MKEATFLGKQVNYPQHYAPEMLVAVPRFLNREQYQLLETDLPFVGFDAWHAYELSFLTERGLPVTGLLKFVYPATNPSLVESKSLKLYLNSFNMGRFGQTLAEGLEMVLATIKKDLSSLLQTDVQVSFFDTYPDPVLFDFDAYELLEKQPEVETLHFQHYSETPELLQTSKPGNLKACTHLLRSNCKITHQPDWGSAYIHLRGKTTPDKYSLLQYLVSIRNENHFHEEICEMIYKRLWDTYQPDELAVTCIYTRRGGIDICPSRASHPQLLPIHLGNNQTLTFKLLRQ
jgi:7-cyano-7-deazaguanine reductase